MSKFQGSKAEGKRSTPLVPAQLAGTVIANGIKEVASRHELSHQHGAALIKACPHELHYVGVLQILQYKCLPESMQQSLLSFFTLMCK